MLSLSSSCIQSSLQMWWAGWDPALMDTLPLDCRLEIFALAASRERGGLNMLRALVRNKAVMTNPRFLELLHGRIPLSELYQYYLCWQGCVRSDIPVRLMAAHPPNSKKIREPLRTRVLKAAFVYHDTATIRRIVPYLLDKHEQSSLVQENAKVVRETWLAYICAHHITSELEWFIDASEARDTTKKYQIFQYLLETLIRHTWLDGIKILIPRPLLHLNEGYNGMRSLCVCDDEQLVKYVLDSLCGDIPRWRQEEWLRHARTSALVALYDRDAVMDNVTVTQTVARHALINGRSDFIMTILSRRSNQLNVEDALFAAIEQDVINVAEFILRVLWPRVSDAWCKCIFLEHAINCRSVGVLLYFHDTLKVPLTAFEISCVRNWSVERWHYMITALARLGLVHPKNEAPQSLQDEMPTMPDAQLQIMIDRHKLGAVGSNAATRTTAPVLTQ